MDQITKYIVIQALPLGASWPREGFFRITHVANTGSAFGLFGGQNAVLAIAALLGIGVLVLFYRTHPNPSLLVRMSLGLMLAGALGNLTDRIRIGWVTDFIDIGPWYIFNVADSAIVTGIVILGASMLFQSPPAESKGQPNGPVPTGAAQDEDAADGPSRTSSPSAGAG